jgi:serine/threonine protein kinase
MQLRKAVQTGRYPPIPASYSPQLSHIIDQMLVVDPNRRISATDLLTHEEVEKRREKQQLMHPAAQPDEENDVELLATIKPPKSRYDVQKLSEKLSEMSAQVATARSESRAELCPVRLARSGNGAATHPVKPAAGPRGRQKACSAEHAGGAGRQHRRSAAAAEGQIRASQARHRRGE